MERWAESKQPSESKTTPRAKQKKKWERRKYTQGLLHCKGVPPWRGYIVIEWYRVVEVILPSVWLVISFESWFSPWRDEQSAQVAEPWYWILDHTRMRHKIPPVCPNSLFVLSAFLWPLLASQVALFSLDESHRRHELLNSQVCRNCQTRIYSCGSRLGPSTTTFSATVAPPSQRMRDDLTSEAMAVKAMSHCLVR